MNKKEMARSLWDMSFGDNVQFTDLYFKKRYTDENTVAIYDGEQMISVLQLLPYPLLWNNTELDSGYISGACTHLEYRNKGAMHQLLKDSLNKLAKENTPICTLIPAEEWLFDYYAKSGFETIFYNAHYNLELTELEINPEIIVSSTTDFTKKLYTYLDKKNRERNTVILHTTQDMEVVTTDLKESGGILFIARNKRNIVGLAFAYFDTDSETVVLYELVSENCSIKQEISKAAAKYFNTTKVRIIAPPYHIEGKPFGMLRIVLAIPLLKIFAKANPKFTDKFLLKDAIIAENSGTYSINNGVVDFSKENIDTDKTISINELAQLLFGESNAYMSLMLD